MNMVWQLVNLLGATMVDQLDTQMVDCSVDEMVAQ
jgi:hypothetical protein